MYMRLTTLALALLIAAGGSTALAKDKKGGKRYYDDRGRAVGHVPPGHGGVPPGLAKKGGLPPGIAKKYAIGDRLYDDDYRRLSRRDLSYLPYGSEAGREWVRVGRDAYLIAESTGIIVDVLEGWFNRRR